MRNIALELSFDGTAYHGWQIQNNAVSVQEVLKKAIFSLTKEEATIIGCSRTDAKVHANTYICAFKTPLKISVDKLPFVFNSILPRDIRVYRAFDVASDFHPIFDCAGKEYLYKIHTAQHFSPFYINRAWHYPYPVDFGLMEKAAKMMTGKRDYKAFMASGGQTKSTVRNVKYFNVTRVHDNLLELRVYADGFLYNMVRIMVGTLVYICRGKIDISELDSLICEGDRTKMGITAPPEGLYLNKVDYKSGALNL